MTACKRMFLFGMLTMGLITAALALLGLILYAAHEFGKLGDPVVWTASDFERHLWFPPPKQAYDQYYVRLGFQDPDEYVAFSLPSDESLQTAAAENSGIAWTDFSTCPVITKNSWALQTPKDIDPTFTASQ